MQNVVENINFDADDNGDGGKQESGFVELKQSCKVEANFVEQSRIEDSCGIGVIRNNFSRTLTIHEPIWDAMSILSKC